MKSTNPLRYPGGKYFLVDYIDKVLNVNRLYECTFYEPYAGSAAVALELLLTDKVEKIVVVEKDPLLYAFWYSVVHYSDELINKVWDLDVSLDTWHQMQKYKTVVTPLECPIIELGLAGLFLNRTNYSGILKANPLGGKTQTSKYKIDCRFNKKTIINHIMRISKKSNSIITHWGDALAFLHQNQVKLHKSHCFVYIDPPYYEKGKSLYRYYYEDDDHRRLAKMIKKHNYPWLISYDDHPFINKLYFENNSKLYQQKLYSDYTANHHKKGKEILISNLHLPPIDNTSLKASNQ